MNPKVKELITPYPVVQRAYELAQEGHKNDYRNDGKTPYMNHIDAVLINTHKLMQSREIYSSFNQYYFVVAILHDLNEDHPDEYPLSYIRDILAPFFTNTVTALHLVMDGIECITKKPKGHERYTEYIKRVMSNRFSQIVKIADLLHNISDLKPGNMQDKYDLTLYVLGYLGVELG